MASTLDGKVALVTGAASGIGKATAQALAAEGADITVADINTEPLQQLVKTMKRGQAIHIVSDISDEEQARALVSRTNSEWGHVDILVNCAGIMLLGPISGANTKDWQRMVNINLLGLMYVTHAVLPHMQAQGGGHIINISSTGGRKVHVGAGIYNVTKWGVCVFSEALRMEVYKDNIHVTVIEPGPTATNLSDQITDVAAKEKTKAYLQTIRQLDSTDIARSIVYAVTQPPYINVSEILIRPLTHEDA